MGNQPSGPAERNPYPRRAAPPPRFVRADDAVTPSHNTNPLSSPQAARTQCVAKPDPTPSEGTASDTHHRVPPITTKPSSTTDGVEVKRRVSLVAPPSPEVVPKAARGSDAATTAPAASKAHKHGSTGGDGAGSRPSLTTSTRVANGSGVGDSSAGARVSSPTVMPRPKLTVAEAKELFQGIFSPKQGDLEVIVSGFLRMADYQAIGLCISQFLLNDMRDRWYLDTPMLAVLGRDRWRSTRNSTETAWPIKPNKQQVRNLIRQRREFTDQLRERLMRASGAAAEAEALNHRYSLQNLLRTYKHADDSVSRDNTSNGADNGLSDDQSRTRARSPATQKDAKATPASLLFQTDSTVSSLASSFAQTSDGLYVTRLRTTVATSFDCYTLIAKRIPQEIIKSFFHDYLLLHVPINDPRLAYEEMRVGDLNKLSFFVSMQNRARLLQGLPQSRTDSHQDMASSNDITLAATTKNYEEYFFLQTFKKLEKHDGKTQPVKVENGAELFTALRNLAMIITTASSSMVLDTLFNLAEVIKSRQRFRELRQDAADRGVALETIIGADKATVRPYLGVPGDNPVEWKRWTTTEEMSLATFVHLVLQRFRSDNESKIQKLRKSFPDLFALLDQHPLHNDREVDATRSLTNLALKLMFLIGGGQRSIEADDRRVPMGARHCTDDVTLSRALEVPVLNRICWVGSMLSMPMMTSRGLLIQERQGRPLTFVEAEECTVIMRELFMAVGALPCGKYCPNKFTEWLNIFPLHAVNTEGKRILMYLYMTQYTPIRPIAIPVQKDMVLLSFAKRLTTSKKFDRKGVCSYLFNPVFSVGCEDEDNMEEEEASKATRRQRRASERHSLVEKQFSTVASDDTSVMQSTDGDNGIGYDYGFADAMASASSNKSKNGGSSPTSRDKRKGGGDGDNTSATRKTLAADDDSSESSNSYSSTLMDSAQDIDVYTCVSLQNQLYLRCANEATVRRHKMTELTPCVTTQFFNGEEALRQGRKDIASLLLRRVPALMPSEAILVIQWKDNEPRVTVHEGDYLSVMVERTRDNSSGIYFRHRESLTGSQAHRTQSIVSVEAPSTPTPDELGYLPSGRLDGEDGGSMYSLFGSSNNSSLNLGEDGMGGLLGVETTICSRRFGMRWQVLSVHPLKQLLPLSERARIKQENHGELPEELALIVSCMTAPLTDPLRIITIGHERSFMSPFTQLGEGNDACWSNPQLMLATVNEEGGDSLAASGTDSRRSSLAASLSSFASGTFSAFCRTEEELQRVFFATGVLLANTVANAVYFSIPLAPLAFSLFKKAVQSGDYSFRSFTWLEPCEGNLLSPAFLLNSAYEVMCMTDLEYYTFLYGKGLADPANLIFPVFKDLGQEREEDRQIMAASGHDQPHPPPTPRSTATSSAGSPTNASAAHGKPFRRQQFSGEASASGSIAAAATEGGGSSVANSRTQRRRRSSIQMYLNAIERHNASGSVFSDRSGSQAGAGGSVSPAPATLLSEMSGSGPGVTALDDLPQLLRQLPSREEYITLYLSNDLAWSSVRKNGYGDQTKGLWVWLAKGFMSSPIAKSPLLLHCCSRVVREVICLGAN